MYFAVVLILGLSLPSSFVLSADETPTKDWWQTASVYQIYPRSFKDSDGDGIGDLKGITDGLSYLKEIGIDAIWMSPIFKSPMDDFGYDISDFYDIQPEYGTLQDFDNLMAKARENGIKILLDFVPNHSSDENEWFVKSLKNDPNYKDYYIWHPGFPDPKNSSNRLPPNNWVSVFRGPAWTWKDERKAFYLHQFSRKQPDLNFRNPAVVQEMKNVLNFWLKRGADGFRMDATPHIFEIEADKEGNYPDEPKTGWTDNPNSYDYLHHIHTKDQPETTEMIYQWRKVLDDYKAENGGDTRIIMTEAYSSMEILMEYYGNGTHEGAQAPFNFLLMTDVQSWSKASDYVRIVNIWMDVMPSDRTANWVLGNHDNRRVASKIGVDKVDFLNMLLMILPGLTVNYYGEEIGMTDVWISWEDTVDPQACNTGPDEYMWFSRDFERTPFQWDDTKNAGFSTGDKTWLPVSGDYRKVNVKTQRGIVRSTLNTYKRAKELRRNSKAMLHGDFKIEAINENILGIRRSLTGERTVVMVANVGTRMERFSVKSFDSSAEVMEVILSSEGSPRRIGDKVHLSNMMLLPSEALFLQSTSP